MSTLRSLLSDIYRHRYNAGRLTVRRDALQEQVTKLKQEDRAYSLVRGALDKLNEQEVVLSYELNSAELARSEIIAILECLGINLDEQIEVPDYKPPAYSPAPRHN